MLDEWVITVGSLAIASGLLVRLRQRVDGLLAELERVSRTDALTGIMNRRGFEQRLLEQLAEHARREAPLGPAAPRTPTACSPARTGRCTPRSGRGATASRAA